MPIKFRWPFNWPRRKPAAKNSPGAISSLSLPASVGNTPAPASAAAAPEAAPIQQVRAEPPARPADVTTRAAPATPAPDLAPVESPDLGSELLGRLPAYATPPTLGRLGGLPAMAQTLSTVQRFIQTLRVPVPPPPALLPGLGKAGEFAANLPSLVGFTATAGAGVPPAFPAQLEPPSKLTEVLAPPGGLSGQIAGLSGAAPVLSPERPVVVPPPLVALPSTPPEAPTAAPGVPLQRAERPETGPSNVAPVAPAWPAAAPTAPTGSRAISALVPPSAISEPAGPMTQVLPLAQTLTGNVLPGLGAEDATGVPIQREAIQRVQEEWTTPDEFVRPAAETGDHVTPGERVSPAQRETIDSQRGQGRPLEPETRQRFEQAYGQPLDAVRVHTGPTAHATAESLNAIAFASGSDLFFTQSSYAPDSPQGLSLIGHELAHVIQQQYGVPGDADALRPADDRYEQQADQLAARALDTTWPRISPLAELAGGGPSIQRAQANEMRLASSPPTLPAASAWAPPEQLGGATKATEQPLASPPLPAGKRPEDEPVQRFMAANPSTTPSAAVNATTIPPGAANAASQLPIANYSLTTTVPSTPLPGLELARQRVGSLTEQLLNPTLMLSHSLGLSQDLPGLGIVREAGQGLPVFRSLRLRLPGMGSLPNLTNNAPEMAADGVPNIPNAADTTNQLPSVSSLPQGVPSLGGSAPSMPDLGNLAQSLGSAGVPRMPNVPSLGGLTSPAMPLAQALGGMGQAAGTAASEAQAAGQQAVGAITSMGPSDAEGPAAPPLPSLDKLTEHIWKEIQRKLKVERERSRGLA